MNDFKSLNDLLSIFEVSASDTIAAKLLSQVSNALVKKRIEKKMNQKEFAQFMQVSQGMVSKWEGADYNFSIKTIAKIADKLDVNVNIVFENDEDNAEKNIPVRQDYNIYSFEEKKVPSETISYSIDYDKTFSVIRTVITKSTGIDRYKVINE